MNNIYFIGALSATPSPARDYKSRRLIQSSEEPAFLERKIQDEL
jgi:hypothetical protein